MNQEPGATRNRKPGTRIYIYIYICICVESWREKWWSSLTYWKTNVGSQWQWNKIKSETRGDWQCLLLKNNSPCLKAEFSKHVQTNNKIDHSRMRCKCYTGYKSSPIYQIWNTIYIYIYIYICIYIHMHICIYIKREQVSPSEPKWVQVISS